MHYLNEVQFPKELQLHLGPLSAACLLDLNEVQFPKELQLRDPAEVGLFSTNLNEVQFPKELQRQVSCHTAERPAPQ